MQIKANSVASIHFSVSTEDGTQIDSTFDNDPLLFMHGQQYLIKGLEDELLGKSAGDRFSLTVEPELAYGERHEQLVQLVPKTMFEGMELEVGMTFRATTDDGEQSVIVIDITDDEVVVDGNHPLSGMTLIFEVEVLEVRDATTEELNHGHPHSSKEPE